MKRKEAVAQEQLPGFDWSKSDRMGNYTTAEIERASAKIDATLELLERHRGLFAFARAVSTAEALERGHVGVRWLGEAVRRWLFETETVGYSNDAVAVLARLLVREEPWLRGFMELRPCALDVAFAMREKVDAI